MQSNIDFPDCIVKTNILQEVFNHLDVFELNLWEKVSRYWKQEARRNLRTRTFDSISMKRSDDRQAKKRLRCFGDRTRLHGNTNILGKRMVTDCRCTKLKPDDMAQLVSYFEPQERTVLDSLELTADRLSVLNYVVPKRLHILPDTFDCPRCIKNGDARSMIRFEAYEWHLCAGIECISFAPGCPLLLAFTVLREIRPPTFEGATIGGFKPKNINHFIKEWKEGVRKISLYRLTMEDEWFLPEDDGLALVKGNFDWKSVATQQGQVYRTANDTGTAELDLQLERIRFAVYLTLKEVALAK